jgi:DNA repair exonuclease SbcCD nuclease subunit
MIRILHTSDLQLGAVFPEWGERATARRNDQWETFERILALAIDRKVHLLAVSGDLFATPWPLSKSVGRVQKGFDRLREHGILPIVLPGQNETSRSADGIYARGILQGVPVLDPLRPECLTLDVGGRPVCLHSGRLENDRVIWPAQPSGGADGVHVGLVCLPARMSASAMSPRWFEDLLSPDWNPDYIALGGLRHYGEWTTDEGLSGCCPGSPEGVTFEEQGPRYCVVVEFDGGSAWPKKYPVNRRTLVRKNLDIGAMRTGTQILETIRSAGAPDTAMQLFLTGKAEKVFDFMALSRQAADAFYYLQAVDQTTLLDGLAADAMTRKNDLSGSLVRRARAMAEEGGGDKRSVIESALREILLRRQSLQGEQS